MARRQITHRPPEDRHDIKALIGKRGLTLAEVGRLCEPPVSRQAVSSVLAGDTASVRIEATIAVVTDLTLAQVQEVTRAKRPTRRFRQAA